MATGRRRRKESVWIKILKKVLSFGLFVLIVLGVTFFIVTYVTHRSRVHTSSMEATLYDGDNIMMDTISYRFHEPERFDIVSFPYEADPNEYLIKRIIGLPGEKVQIKEGKIFINDEELAESYGLEVIQSGGRADIPVQLGTDEYFVMGDNRNDSLDSRMEEVGNIKREDIGGKAWLRIWPLKSFGLLTSK
ncbi:MAG TPA: signal peptidase I [Lachnospiraceae bacterium]|mgnify:CR=1 FL=1|jgi:signal peptidase I|nr:signal peptidase I [Lachnospiraceae bacterium]